MSFTMDFHPGSCLPLHFSDMMVYIYCLRSSLSARLVVLIDNLLLIIHAKARLVIVISDLLSRPMTDFTLLLTLQAYSILETSHLKISFLNSQTKSITRVRQCQSLFCKARVFPSTLMPQILMTQTKLLSKNIEHQLPRPMLG